MNDKFVLPEPKEVVYDHGREIFELRPLNPAYPVMNSQQLKLSVVGVVVEAIKRF